MSVRACLCLSAIVASSLSGAQVLPTQSSIWTLTAAANSLATVPVYGRSATVEGFKFKVTARADGALPVVRTLLNRDFIGGDDDDGGVTLNLYKRVTATAYALVTDWFQTGNSTSSGAGVILTAGDYLVAGDDSDTGSYAGSALVSGFWASKEYQANYWKQEAGLSSYVSVLDYDGYAVKGFRFTVAARADGALPLVNQTPTILDDGEYWHTVIYRLGSNGRYFVYASLTPYSAPNPGLILTPGTYLAKNEIFTGDSATAWRFATLLTGFWIKK